jgi:hypothetical protein
VTGYAYPPGRWGQTGYPGSTPAARPTHTQGASGRKDPNYLNRPTITASGIRARDTGPEFNDPGPVEVPRPQPPYSRQRFRPGTSPEPGNTFISPSGAPRRPKARNQRLATGFERRMSPVIGLFGMTEPKNVRNTTAQDWKAVPGQVRAYKPAANPGKTGAHLNGPSFYHPTQNVRGTQDGAPIPGITHALDGAEVNVLDRAVFGDTAETSSYYAMNRPAVFSKLGYPAFPPGYEGDYHIRGGRYDGTRYFGPLEDQQEIGLPSDAYGRHRALGPNHRPVRFSLPAPWTANYYDVAAPAGATSPDMIHQSAGQPPGRPRTTKKTSRSAARRTPRG